MLSAKVKKIKDTKTTGHSEEPKRIPDKMFVSLTLRFNFFFDPLYITLLIKGTFKFK